LKLEQLPKRAIAKAAKLVLIKPAFFLFIELLEIKGYIKFNYLLL